MSSNPKKMFEEALEAAQNKLTEAEVVEVVEWFLRPQVREILRRTMEAYDLPSLRDHHGDYDYSGDQEGVFNTILAEHLRKGLRKDQISLQKIRKHLRFRIIDLWRSQYGRRDSAEEKALDITPAREKFMSLTWHNTYHFDHRDDVWDREYEYFFALIPDLTAGDTAYLRLALLCNAVEPGGAWDVSKIVEYWKRKGLPVKSKPAVTQGLNRAFAKVVTYTRNADAATQQAIHARLERLMMNRWYSSANLPVEGRQRQLPRAQNPDDEGSWHETIRGYYGE